jgi:DNA-binding transcriptional regulator LsrR (DeoR family)
MAKTFKLTPEGKIDLAIGLLQHLLAVELYTKGVKQDLIAKHLHVATAKVTKMLQGVKREM